MGWEQLIKTMESLRDNGWEIKKFEMTRPAIEDIPRSIEEIYRSYKKYKPGDEAYIEIMVMKK